MAQTTERVPFRLIQTPCCSTLLCYVNPRLPNYCSECGTNIWKDVKGCILLEDQNALLKVEGFHPTVGESPATPKDIDK